MDMTQEEFTRRLIAADITVDGWFDELLKECDDLYARGYLQAKAYVLSNIFSYNEEGFREDMITAAKSNIWGVK